MPKSFYNCTKNFQQKLIVGLIFTFPLLLFFICKIYDFWARFPSSMLGEKCCSNQKSIIFQIGCVIFFGLKSLFRSRKKHAPPPPGRCRCEKSGQNKRIPCRLAPWTACEKKRRNYVERDWGVEDRKAIFWLVHANSQCLHCCAGSTYIYWQKLRKWTDLFVTCNGVHTVQVDERRWEKRTVTQDLLVAGRKKWWSLKSSTSNEGDHWILQKYKAEVKKHIKPC